MEAIRGILSKFYSKSLLLILVAGIIIGIFIFNDYDLVLRGLLKIGTPIILVVTLLYKYERTSLYKSSYDFEINNLKVNCIFTIFYLSSIWMRIFFTNNPLPYFLLLSICYLLTFYQIFAQRESTKLSLFKILILQLNLALGVTLMYPLYFGWRDILPHLYYSEITSHLGQTIPQTASLNYSNFPLFHILAAQSFNLFNLSNITSFFLVTNIPFIFTTLIVYYTFLNFNVGKRISLLTSLFYSTSYFVIFYSRYTVTRAFAFIGFILLLYFMSRYRENNINYIILSVLISIFIVLVHSVSSFQFILIFGVLLLAQRIYKTNLIEKRIFFIFLLIFISYWLLLATEYTAHLVGRFFLSPETEAYEELIIGDPIEGMNLNLLWNYIYMFLLTLFVLFGIGTIFKDNKNRNLLALVFSSLLFAIFYIENPLTALWQTMEWFRFDRFILFVAPFSSLALGIGIFKLFSLANKGSRMKKNKKPLIVSILVFLFILVSITQPLITRENPLPGFQEDRDYFNQKEIEGLDYMRNKSPSEATVISDRRTNSYFFRNTFERENEYYGYYVTQNIQKMNESTVGYIIIREETDSREYFIENSTNKVYENNGLTIYYQNED